VRVTSVRLFNWMRFSGVQEVALDATVYAVTAQFEHDDRRSNWAGKTSLLEAIRFALYGVHRAAREDDWISHGEASGYVEVTLSDGTLVRRERRRGSATRLLVQNPKADESAHGDDAQRVLVERVGLTREDFDATCWMAQKQLARLVTARPAERFEVVSGWVGLGPLQRCEDRARAKLAAASTAMTLLDAQATAAESVLVDECGRLGLPAGSGADAVVGSLEALVAVQAALAGEAGGKVQAATATLTRAHLAARRAQAAAETDAVAADLTRMRTEFEALPPVVPGAASALADARAAMQAAGGEAKQKGALARGEFDGRCPVGNITCPATDALNAQRRENATAHKRALALYDDKCQAESAARLEADSARAADERRTALLAKREVLRGRLAVLRAEQAEQAEDAPSVGEAERALGAATLDHSNATYRASATRDALTRVEQARARIAATRDAVVTAREDAAVLRAAVRLFGRQGAQQRIAEAALADIESGANALLREASIDLSVTVRWAREGQGLATSCDSCGAAHPASQRVKRCERCGAERGPKLVERLDVDLSDRSGAAEDLAGAALQLAASSWLRAERGVQWGTAFIDEPFGALDEANRKAFAAHLTAMLRGRFGFEQAFVVAHSPDVLDAMPGRVTVMADEYGSRAEVA